MCGLVTVNSKDTDFVIPLLDKLIIENSIRGIHATGVAWIDNGKINNLVMPISGDDFVKTDEWINVKSNLQRLENINLLIHSRYSTSDVEFNQPIIKDGLAIALNGVITQHDFKHWKTIYPNMEFTTRNDAEILLNCILNSQKIKDLPKDHNYSMSIAGAVLHKNSTLIFRNGRRPLYFYRNGNTLISTSTKQIATRSGMDANLITKYDINKIYIIENGELTNSDHMITDNEDWQL